MADGLGALRERSIHDARFERVLRELELAQMLGSAGPRMMAVSNVPLLVPMNTPDASGNGYPDLTTNHGFANLRAIIPYFTKSVDGTWQGSFPVPSNYASGGTVVLTGVANATSGAVRWQVLCGQTVNGSSADLTLTAETAQNVTVPGTANQAFDTTFTLAGTTPTAGGAHPETFVVQVKRVGSNAGDTLAVDCGLLAATFLYTTT
jgi:hypothetical protein